MNFETVSRKKPHGLQIFRYGSRTIHLGTKNIL